MRIKINILPILIAVMHMICVASCFSGRAEKRSSGAVTPTPERLSASDRQTDFVQVDKQIFVRKDGWKVPEIPWEKGQKTIQQTKSDRGKQVGIELVEIEPHPFPVISEPLGESEGGSRKIQIQNARAFSFRNQIFCYRFLVNHVKVDDDAKVFSSIGALFFFSYYDEDGDGIFETLYFDEPGPTGTPSFFAPPHLPKWILVE